MSTFVRPSHLVQIVDKIKTKILSSLIPLHARRAYFMASLARHFCDNSIPDEVLAKNVSAAMNHLVSPRGLIYFFNKQSMWEGLPKGFTQAGDQLDQSKIAIMNQQAVDCAPDWLRYGNERSMRKDAQLAALAAVASNHSTTFQRKLVQTYNTSLAKPKRRGVLATVFLGKE